LKRLGYIILEHETNLPTTKETSFNDDKDEILQSNNDNIIISSDDNNIKEQLTQYINNFSTLMDHFGQSKVISSTPLSHLYRKSVYWFDKLFTIPFSLAFSLETNPKINYFKNQKNNTQPLYNYYDNNSLGNKLFFFFFFFFKKKKIKK